MFTLLENILNTATGRNFLKKKKSIGWTFEFNKHFLMIVFTLNGHIRTHVHTQMHASAHA